MALRLWIAKKIAGKYINKSPNQAVITDEMRERALIIRRQEHALKQKEKEVEMLERIMNIETRTNPKETWEEQLVKQVLPMLLTKTGNTLPVGQELLINQNQEISKPVDFTDDQIKAIIASNPKIKKFAPNFTDDQIKEYVMNQIPNISRDSLEKIVIEVRT